MNHIAILLPELEAGGAQRVMLLLAREFVARGHCVDLVILSSSGILQNEVPIGVNLVNLAARRYGLGNFGLTIIAVLRLAWWLKRERPDVLLSTITGANLVALLAKRILHGSPKVVVREAATLKNVRTTLLKRAMRWLYPHADAVIALSRIMADELISELRISSSKIYQISNPVDLDYLQEKAKQSLDHPWLNNPKLKTIISVGRLVPQKNFALLLRALALLPSNLPVRLIIVGEGPELTALQHLAVELTISEKVDFIGFDKNPWRWMSRADLFVLSSLWEGYPNALLEALALNIPVLATEYDASVYDLAAQYHISVVPAEEPKAMAAAIDSLLKNNEQTAPHMESQIKIDIIDSYLEVLTE